MTNQDTIKIGQFYKKGEGCPESAPNFLFVCGVKRDTGDMLSVVVNEKAKIFEDTPLPYTLKGFHLVALIPKLRGEHYSIIEGVFSFNEAKELTGGGQPLKVAPFNPDEATKESKDLYKLAVPFLNKIDGDDYKNYRLSSVNFHNSGIITCNGGALMNIACNHNEKLGTYLREDKQKIFRDIVHEPYMKIEKAVPDKKYWRKAKAVDIASVFQYLSVADKMLMERTKFHLLHEHGKSVSYPTKQLMDAIKAMSAVSNRDIEIHFVSGGSCKIPIIIISPEGEVENFDAYKSTYVIIMPFDEKTDSMPEYGAYQMPEQKREISDYLIFELEN